MKSETREIKIVERKNFMKSWTGKEVIFKETDIRIYNKYCPCSGGIEILIREYSETKKGAWRTKAVTCNMNKEEVIELRNKLNEIDLD